MANPHVQQFPINLKGYIEVSTQPSQAENYNIVRAPAPSRMADGQANGQDSGSRNGHYYGGSGRNGYYRGIGIYIFPQQC